MRTANSVIMAGDLERIVALAADVERWPEILPHYRWVTLLEGGGDRKTVEMAARRGRIPVKWRAIQEIERDGQSPVIRYRHIGGVTKGMEVAWTFEPGPNVVGVRIDHDFTPPWPLVGGVIAERIIGPHFVAAIAGQTLQTIKAIVENRDERFDPDGQLRSPS
ncbi:MAG: type II toxin-antitoxin system RatA family toxin [Thermomicrobiales bacterium]